MSVSVDQAFVKQFEAEVKLAYQRGGTKLRNCVRTKTNVTGKDTTFQKVGKGVAGTKTRHGLVPTMSLDHTNVTCSLADYYAADYVDKLDELKTNIDERGVVAMSGANAIGRKTDDLVIQAADAGSTNVITEGGSVRLIQSKINTVFNYMGNNDIPDDGERYWVMGPSQWTDMLAITAFSSADYVAGDELPYKGGMVAKRWMGFMWFVHSGLNVTGSIRNNLVFHKTAIGAASGAEVSSTWDWIPERVAFLYNASISQGACVIDTQGLYKVQVAE